MDLTPSPLLRTEAPVRWITIPVEVDLTLTGGSNLDGAATEPWSISVSPRHPGRRMLTAKGDGNLTRG